MSFLRLVEGVGLRRHSAMDNASHWLFIETRVFRNLRVDRLKLLVVVLCNGLEHASVVLTVSRCRIGHDVRSVVVVHVQHRRHLVLVELGTWVVLQPALRVALLIADKRR